MTLKEVERSPLYYNHEWNYIRFDAAGWQYEVIKGNVTTTEDPDGIERISEKFLKFDKGTDIQDIWRWFDFAHPKGIAYLANTYESKPVTYQEMKKIFEDYEAGSPKKHLIGYIIFASNSFDKPYPIESRTYIVTSDNKRYKPNMISSSIWANNMDGSDTGVRLDWYMAEENYKDGIWIVENCYIEYAL